MARFSQLQSDRYIRFDLFIGGQRIETYKYFESFTFSFGSDSDWSGNISLFDPDWDFIESIIIGTQASSDKGFNSIVFSFGWNDDVAGPYEAAILAYAPKFSHEGVRLELKLTHPTTVIQNTEVWTGSWPTGITQSKIVEDLLPHLGKHIKGSVIEKSLPYTSGPIILPRVHPENWIKKQFCGLDADKPPISAERPGIGGYEFSIDNEGILHFHAPGFEGRAKDLRGKAIKGKSAGIIRSYIFAKDDLGQVLSFEPADLSKFCQIMGAGRSASSTIDSKKKIQRKSGASHDGSAGTKPAKYIADNNKIPGVGARKDRLTHYDPRPFRDKNAIDQHVLARYSRLANSHYAADLEIMGDPFLNYNQYINITMLKKDGQKHYTSGTYRIKRVEHQIQGGSFTTSLNLEKSSAKDAAEAVDKVTPIKQEKS